MATDRDTIIILTTQRTELMQELLNIQGYRFNSATERRWDRIERKIDSIDRKLEALTKRYVG